MTSPFLKKPGPAARKSAKRDATDATPLPPRAKKAPTARASAEYALMLEDLARSALDADDAKLMRLEPKARDELSTIAPPGAGYVIPYFHRDGRVDPVVYRYRYLEDTRKKGFGALGSAKARRYTQPSGTPPGVYWAPFTDWETIAADPTVPLVVTEGEKKAAIATKMGLPTVGLGGVWSFKSKSIGVRLLEDLRTVDWSQRTVFIAYDSDAVVNSDVCRAESALADELTRQGAIVKLIRIPELEEGKKCGLDDYLVSEGAERFMSLCDATEPYSQGKELHRMNTEVVYVQDPGIVVVRKTWQMSKPSDFVAHRFADRQYTRTVVDAKGNLKMEVRQTAPDWIKWPQRAVATKLVFAPGEDDITPARELNLWKGWPYQPKRGDVSLWTKLLDFLFDGQPESRRWLEQWAAYPIQHPGTKLRNGVAMWGLRKGTGKSLVGYTLGDLYGDAFYEITDEHIDGTSSHNEWANCRAFVMGDEISGDDSRRVANRIKNMITREKIEINPKHVRQYTIVDCINYYFTSNLPDCFYIEEDDRRLFIHEVVGEPLPRQFYRDFDAWRRSDAGRQALMWHLMYGVDTSEFDPMAEPPVTSAKRDMFADTRTELESWLLTVRDFPDLICAKFGDSDLISIQELSVLHEAMQPGRPASSQLLGRKLKELGVNALRPKDAPDARQIFAGGKLVRLYALRNHDKWEKATVEVLRREYEKSRGLVKPAAPARKKS